MQIPGIHFLKIGINKSRQALGISTFLDNSEAGDPKTALRNAVLCHFVLCFRNLFHNPKMSLRAICTLVLDYDLFLQHMQPGWKAREANHPSLFQHESAVTWASCSQNNCNQQDHPCCAASIPQFTSVVAPLLLRQCAQQVVH